jgi:hypothetical protein
MEPRRPKLEKLAVCAVLFWLFYNKAKQFIERGGMEREFAGMLFELIIYSSLFSIFWTEKLELDYDKLKELVFSLLRDLKIMEMQKDKKN